MVSFGSLFTKPSQLLKTSLFSTQQRFMAHFRNGANGKAAFVDSMLKVIFI